MSPGRPRGLIMSASLLAALACLAGGAHAQWVPNGLLIAPSARQQSSIVSASDGNGGAIVAWVDSGAASGKDVYVQRISAAGVPLWTTGGVELCTETGDQEDPAISGDGAGGAIVAWVDRRSGSPRVYVQRVASTGVAAWTANGIGASTSASAAQLDPDIASDGAGGVFVVWEYEVVAGDMDLRMQRIDSSGARLYTLDALGAVVASGPTDSREPRIVMDGGGLPVIVWRRVESSNSMLRAQRMTADLSTSWESGGREVSHAPGGEYHTRARVTAIGSSRTATCWRDSTTADPGQIWVSALDAAGSRVWLDTGVAVCTATGIQRDPVLVSDGAGGVIVAWGDSRGASSDIYAQRVSSAGAVQWVADGVPVSTLAGAQGSPAMVSDGAGGAIVAWADRSAGSGGIAAQRINASGVPQWPAAGVPLGAETLPPGATSSLVSDGAAGAIAGWTGAGAGAWPNARAQRVFASGVVVPHFITAIAGPDGAISPSGAVPVSEGGQLSFTMTPNPFHRVADVRVDGGSLGAVPSYTFSNVVTDHTIEVSFEPDPILVTASAGPNGAISPSGVTQYSPLASVTYTITPASGHGVQDVLVDDVSVGAVTSYTFTGLAASHTIAATFAPGWTANGRLVNPSDSAQSSAVAASDGAGGTIVAWVESRGASQSDIFVQRVSATGVPVWGDGGVALCSAPGVQDDPAIVGDGAGGATVVWVDRRGAQPRIYAQRVRGNGVAAWTADGITVSAAATFAQLGPEVTDAGACGALVVWEYVTGGSTADLIVQQLDSTGTRAYAGNGGLGAPVVTTGDSREPRVVREVQGLPVIAWIDKGAVPTKVWAQRMRADWAPDGSPWSFGSPNHQSQIRLVSLGTGGTAYAWRDSSATDPGAIWVKRRGTGGQSYWGGPGTNICAATGAQRDPVLIADETGDVIVAWGDARGGSSDIYAQRVELGGAVLWTANGAAVVALAGPQIRPSAVADGSGGAIITWVDTSGAGGSVAAQRVTGSGALQWPAAGAELYQGVVPAAATPISITDSAGGAVAVWAGGGIGGEPNLRAQRVLAGGLVVPRTITASAGPGGSITPVGTVLVASGASQSFTITPGQYRHIEDVLVDGGSIGPVPDHTFIAVTADHTIHATFAPDTFTITASAGANGAISPSGPVQVLPLASVTFTITPGAGQAIQDVLVDSVSVGAVSSYTFPSVTTSHTIAASFAPTWAVNGRIIAPSAFAQSAPVAASDGAGGLVVAWVDSRAGSHTDIYVQRVSGSGVPEWDSGGVPVCTVAGNQEDPAIAGDGAGGAIVAWVDRRGVTPRVYVQRVNATGGVMWGAGGVTASAGAASAQLDPDIAHAGASGIFVAWEYHVSASRIECRVQGLDSDGTRAASDPLGASAEVSMAGKARSPRLVRDFDGLPVVAWTNADDGTVRTQRLLSNWTRDWGDAGVVLGTSGGVQSQVRITDLGAIGTAYVWRDSTTADPGNIRVQRVNTVGSRAWGSQGKVLCQSPGLQQDPVLVGDTLGGVIVAWTDLRSGTGDIRARRTTTSGDSMMTWPAHGLGVCTLAGSQVAPAAVPDGVGGMIVAWLDTTSGIPGMGAQRVSGTGAVTWAGSGLPIYSGPVVGTGSPTVVGDGGSGVLAAWAGAGAGSEPNIRAQRAHAAGVVVPHTITATAGPNGTISPPGTIQVSEGTSQVYTITPNAYHHIVEVVVDGASIGAATGHTFPNIVADHTIAATFAPDTFTITASAGAGGDILPTGAIRVAALTTAVFTIRPDYGYVIQDVLVDDESVGADSSYTFSSVTEDHTIATTFLRFAWPPDSLVVAAAADGDRMDLKAIADGSGGTIFAWGDTRSGARGVYVQRVGPEGTRDWAANGVRVLPTTGWGGSSDELRLVGDDAGGALVACVGGGGGDTIRVVHISASGQLAWSRSIWLGLLKPFQAVPDGVGGIWLARGTQVQHMDAAGNATSSGPLPTFAGTPSLIADDQGGVVVAWSENSLSSDVYDDVHIQRFTADGDPMWPLGRRLTTAAGNQSVVGVTGDGAGGAIVVWEDVPSNTMWAGRVDAGGAYLWPFDGVPVTTGAEADPREVNGLYDARLASDGRGGLLLSYRSGHNHIMAQRLDAEGDARWTTEGLQLYAASASGPPESVVDGAGGVMVFWAVGTGSGDVVGQHVAGDGTLLWPVLPLVIAGGGQDRENTPAAAGDGESGAVVGWLENPAGGANDFQVHARRVLFQGQFGSPAHRITASSGTFGDISPSGVVGLAAGANLTFTIAPDPSCRIVDVLVNGISQGPITSYPFANVQGDHSIVASFEQILHSVTALSSPGGIVTPAGIEPVLEGESRTYTVLPNDGFRVGAFLVDGESQGPVSTYTLANITAPHTISAMLVRDSTLDGGGWNSAGRVVNSTNLAQTGASHVSDGHGGTFAVWIETGSQIGSRLLAQRFDAGGRPLWATGGVALTAQGKSFVATPTPAADGLGGLSVCWLEKGTGNQSTPRYQRLRAQGLVVHAAGGVSLASPRDGRIKPRVQPLEGGRVVVAWGESPGTRIHMVAVDSAGTIDDLGTSKETIGGPAITSGGTGAFYLAWEDRQGGLRVKRVQYDGTELLPETIVSPTGSAPALIPGADSSVVMVWSDTRNGNPDLYAQRIASTGVSMWGPSDVAVSTAPNQQGDVSIAPDGARGALISWIDSRSAATSADVYAQRLNLLGQALWTADGVPVCTAPGPQRLVDLDGDGTGGAYLTWRDARGADTTDTDIRVQRLDAAGNALWTSDGVRLGNSAGYADAPGIALTPAGSAAAVWQNDHQVLVQRISPVGRQGHDHGVFTSTTPNGTISPSGTVGVFSTSSQPFTIAAAPNWRVRDVLVNGISQGAVTSLQLDGIVSDQALHVIIAPAALAGDSTSHLVARFDFEDPDGTCRTRDWIGADLAHRVFGHVSPRFVENSGDIAMGARALWFGADSTSAPDETSGWVYGTGFGNSWSQRIVSPAFSRDTYPNALLRFDATLDLSDTGGLVDGDRGNEFLGVQAERLDGRWVFLTAHYTPNGGATFTDTCVAGRGAFSAQVFLGADGNDTLDLGATTRLRIVVQTDSLGSPEDGGRGPGRGAAVVDNLSLVESSVPVLPAVDFEDGTTGGWSLAAQNGSLLTPGGNPSVTRDTPPPGTEIALRTGFDPADLSCAWTFVSAGDSLPNGVHARLTSPWLPLADREDDWALGFAGRFPTFDHRRVVQVRVRGKDAGDAAPRFVSRLGTWVRNAVPGGDLAAPFDTLREYRYYTEFIDPRPADSIQLVFLIEDRAELHPAGFSGRPASRLPMIDRVYVTQLAADQDGDGVADNFDLCPNSKATGQDADGDGCIDETATFRHVETWEADRLPIRYTISQEGVPSITDGSDLQAIRDAFDAWADVDGAAVPFDELPVSADTTASAVDGVNLITFQDDEFEFPYGVIAIAPTTSFLRRASFGDRVVQPGQIVDSDVIFNPIYPFRTGSAGPPGGFDLRSVATHEIGHLLGLTHSGVRTATMFPVLQPDTLAASLAADDRAAIAAAYPDNTIEVSYGTVLGAVRYTGTLAPVPGAAVYAVRLDVGDAPGDTVSSDFTREDGAYALRRLDPGRYSIRVAPLDGLVPGLEPRSISARVYAIARTDFEAEWFSEPEDQSDTTGARSAFDVAAGSRLEGLNIVVNPDARPPVVLAVQPVGESTDIHTDTAMRIDFSERVDIDSLAAALFVRIEGQNGRLAGHLQPMNGGQSVVFVPAEPLHPGTTYEIRITTRLADRNGVPLEVPVVSRFETRAANPIVTVERVSPAVTPIGGLVTLIGAGFDPADPASNRVLFTRACQPCEPETTQALMVNPRSLTVAVPASAVSGPVSVLVGSNPGNGLPLTVASVGSIAPPTPLGVPVQLYGAPTDVAITPNGSLGVAVGRHGLETIPLSPVVGTATRYPIGASRDVVVSLDGLRALVTQPEGSRVVEVTLASGIEDLVMPIEGIPGAIALSPDGRRAVVTDAAAPLLHVLDVDPGSATRGAVLDTLGIPYPGTSRGVAYEPSGRFILVSREDAGLVALDYATRLWTVVNDGTPSGGVASHPDGRHLIAAGESGLLTARGDPAAGALEPGISVLAGALRDVVVTPSGRCAVAVSPTHNRVTLVDLQATSGTFRTEVASAPTGAAPVAIALSTDGTRGVVGNSGDSTVTVFGFGGSTAFSRLAPDAGAPGDVIAALGSGAALVPGTQVDVAGGMVPVTHAVGSAVSFAVPDADAQPTTVTLAPPAGAERSLSLPFSVLPAPGAFAPVTTTFTITLPRGVCTGDSGFRPVERLSLSPDGRWLAALEARATASGCTLPAAVSLFEASDRGSHPLGSRRWTAELPLPPTGMTFDATGRRLWIAMHDGLAGQVQVLDTDASSPQFGAITGTLTDPLAGRVDGIVADPLGRHLYLASSLDQRVTIATPVAVVADTVAMTGFAPIALAPSPDGRYVVVASPDRLWFLDAASGSVAASTAPLAGFTPAGLAVPVGGESVFAHDREHRLGIWSLAAGSTGEERFLGAAFAPGESLLAIAPAPTRTAVIVSLAGRDSLVQLDAAALEAGPGPTIERRPLPTRPRALARSADGRRMWSVSSSTSPASPDSIQLLALEQASRVVLISGGGQAALAGTPVATPVRVKVTNATGRGLPGALVRFATSNGSSGGIDGAGPGSAVHRITDARGEVAVAWVLPDSLGGVTLEARVPGTEIPSAEVPATSVASDAVAPPSVLATGPSNGAEGIDPGTRILIRFSQRMDSTSVASRFMLHAGGSPVAGSFHVQEGGRVMLFRPEQPLPFDASCSMTLAEGALDREGQALAALVTASFTTAAAPPLSIRAITPRAANGKVPLVLSGRGFSRVPSENVVFFSGRPATVKTAADNALVVQVPEEAVSGDVWAVVNGTPTNRVYFQRLYDDPLTPAVYATGETSGGSRSAAMSLDGSLVYLTQPRLNTIEVVRVAGLAVTDVIPVGEKPIALAVLASPARLYVLNKESEDVSVVDIEPGSPDEHEVIETFGVGGRPRDIAVSPVGPRVFIASGEEEGVQILERRAGTSQHHVVATVKTGSGTKGVAISTDGGHLVVTTGEGVTIVNLVPLAAGHDPVVTTVKTGSGTKGVAISTDGGLALILGGSGQAFIVSLRPGVDQYSILDTLEVDESAQGVAFTPDGGHVLFAVQDQGSVHFVRIEITASDGDATSDPGAPALTVTEQDVEIGEAPAGIAVDPFGAFALVTDEARGRITLLGLESDRPIGGQFHLDLETVHLGMGFPWVRGAIELPLPETPMDIDPDSVRVAGSVPADLSRGTTVADADLDGRLELALSFPRARLDGALAPGDTVIVPCTGRSHGRKFDARDTLRVRRGAITSPAAGASVPPGQSLLVQYSVAANPTATSIRLLESFDRGRTWSLAVASAPNTGSLAWTPSGVADSVVLSVVQVDAVLGDSLVRGVVGTSGVFRIGATTDAGLLPAVLEFSPLHPNPARGEIAMRFGLPRRAHARLELFDLQGRRVVTLMDGVLAPGWHVAAWDGRIGRSSRGGRAAAGVYFARLVAEGRTFLQRLVWLD